MSDDVINTRLTAVQAEIEQRKVQLREIRFNYDLAKGRLAQVERQLKLLEERYELLAQGQLPLNFYDDSIDL